MVANLGKAEPPAARRGTRRRRRRESALVWWALFAAFGVAAWMLHSWRVALLGLVAWCLYQFVLVPTFCRVMTRQGYSCTERARGRLFACKQSHQRVKTDALWRMVGLRNPRGRKAREEHGDTGVVVFSPAVRGRLAPADRTLIMLAAVGTIVSLVGTVYGLG
ncbi:hypothetical protein AGRA3207_005239 [Actinomadura graeca]|uniref:Uncharacterized protein n=1 Tax=Actinomadura graeca TaxID=2750812 RepID=A0ABX8R0A0_9ACTN|nr:hypothetical protein [Actinomadura graeca]QXJ23996.1 hypothetical protein AGRA3207_005239 [Actinomadura graeca]